MRPGEEAIPVRFRGVDLIWLKNADGSGPLAPLEHVDGAGNVRPEHCFSLSFGHVKHGKIYRLGSIIGSVDELERAGLADSAASKRG